MAGELHVANHATSNSNAGVSTGLCTISYTKMTTKIQTKKANEQTIKLIDTQANSLKFVTTPTKNPVRAFFLPFVTTEELAAGKQPWSVSSGSSGS